MDAKITPILLLTGYLGSGKTTLVNRILTNQKGIRFAVIVNDIGEVNIDADLIQKGGVVGQGDDSLVPLQNGCICCTLKMDLVNQICDLIDRKCFDYIVIEASGICEPEPIAQTICSIPRLSREYTKNGIGVLDCIVTVCDALRLQSEFDGGQSLRREGLEEEDIENLIIQQIEFCNLILLNKASEVEPRQLERIKAIIRGLQPKAEIIECDYAEVELEKLLATGLFDFEDVATSATWIREMEAVRNEEEAHPHDEDDDDEHHHHDDDDDDHDGHEEHHHEGGHHHEHEEEEHGHHHHDEDDDHEHHHHHHDDDEEGGEHHHNHDDHEEHGHHHHHHHHGEGEAEEYGIGTFVYYRRKPFNMNRFDYFVSRQWDHRIIRSKGLCWFSDNPDMSYVFEQAGVQKKLTEGGQWYATAPEDELEMLKAQDPHAMDNWDEVFGDRMQKIVFIGQHLDKEAITRALDACLEK